MLIAQEISRRMKSELGITVSVGVSFNKIFVIVNKKVPFLSEKIPHLFLSIYRREIPADKILALTIQILDSDFYSSCDTRISSTFICSVAASFLGLPRRLVDVILSRSFMR